MARLARALVRLLPPLALVGLAAVAASMFGCAVIAGASMEPALTPGDVLVYRRGPAAVAERDLVVLARPGWRRPVVHRVVALTPGGGVVTRGDANPIADLEPSSAADVRGRGVAVAPTGRLLRRLAALSRRARLLLQPKSSMR